MGSAIDHDFWKNQLEVPVERVVASVDAGALGAWFERLSPRCRAILLESIGQPTNRGIPQTRKAMFRFREQILPLVLVDAAMSGKRASAICEVARTVLGEEDLERVRVGGGLDRHAAAWMLYLRGRVNLQRVFYIDRTHRRGTARLVLEGAVPARAAVDFFGRDRVAAIVAGLADGAPVDPSVDVLTTEEHHLVFLRWATKPGFIVSGSENLFGFFREWIALAFAHDLSRVRIASDAPAAGLRVANAIARAAFGESARFANESKLTSNRAADRFVESLVADGALLPLVEVGIATDARDDGTVLRLQSGSDDSVAPQLRQLQLVFGAEVARVPRVRELKVVSRGKRVRLTFEPASNDAVIVRYSDVVFEPRERDAFEREMREAHDIHVLSTEKRHAA